MLFPYGNIKKQCFYFLNRISYLHSLLKNRLLLLTKCIGIIIFIQSNKKSFVFFNVTQFLGALNDNVFKLIIVFLLIHLRGATSASLILSLVGAVFVIPFLLFLSTAGILADRLSKRNILVTMKFAEFFIMLLSLVSIYFQSQIGCFILLFLMATQSAIFSPSKYGILPEIVPKHKLSKANGILNALSFLAIITGTFLGTFITDITNKHFFLAANFCVVIAFIGLLTSLKIKKTPAKRSTKKINPLFLKEIYNTLKLSYKRKHLLPSIFGAGYFLFIGGYAQLNTIPYAIESLGLTDLGGGYLFTSTAVGIAIGSLIAGKVSKDRVELGLSCVSGFVVAFLLLVLGVFSTNLVMAIILLILLGVFGGMFLIPFETFLQVKSPENRRGQIIAAANFVSFLGVLIASFLLYLFSNVFHFSAATGFFIIGIITFIFNFINTGRLSDVFLPYFVKKFLKHFYRVEVNLIPPKNSIIVSKEFSWPQALTLFWKIDNLKIITVGKKLKNFPFLSCLSNTINIISESKVTLEKLKSEAEKLENNSTTLCILLKHLTIEPAEIKNTFPDNKIYLMQSNKYQRTKKVLWFNTSKTIFTTNFTEI